MGLPNFDADEVLLRSLRRKDIDRASGRIKWNALRLTGSTTELSLIRRIIGDNEAKRAAKHFVHNGQFYGFGCATHDRLLRHCEEIRDDPDPFVGHVSMRLGYPTPPADPTNEIMTPQVANAQIRLRELSREFEIRLDPDPDSDSWDGPSLAGTN